jgi:hypothetical protein
MTNKATVIDLLLYEAAEADFKLKLAKLQEFYDAATAPNVIITPTHSTACRMWRAYGRLDLCDCGAAERQERIDKASAALADDAEGDA